MKVTAQFNALETTQNLFIYNLIGVCLLCKSPNSQVSFPMVIFKPTPFLVPSYGLSLTPFIHYLCISLSLFRLFPLYFYLLPFHINSILILTSSTIEKSYLNKDGASLGACSQELDLEHI
jgi:hypothetical protein